MIFNSISDWLLEQEHKKKPAVFLLEWFFTFAFAVTFWTVLFYEFETSIRSTAVATTISMLYACSFVYIRLLPLTRCKKCNSPLPLARKEIGRRHIHNEEKCLEIEHAREIDAEKTAREFRESGADAISVVVEPKIFRGDIGNITLAKKAGLPVLFKDFIISEEQVAAARDAGADAVLLVVRVARRKGLDLDSLIRSAHGMGLEVLLESY